MIDIALHQDSSATQLKDISRRQAVSAKYLDHLLSSLRKTGLIKSTRSRQAGYSLSRPAKKITLKDIVLVLEGSLAPVDCVDNPGACPRVKTCSSRAVWSKLKKEMERALASVTLQDLVNSKKTKGKASLQD
jgi:Rrf2 family transcriptional regulator, cysteine metabolism repressor